MRRALPPTLLLALLALPVVGCRCDRRPASTPAAPAAPDEWNGAQVAWQPFEEGLAAAARDARPVCLVFFTSWCPHCRTYSRVFSDPRIVEASKDFVMIRLDRDQNPQLSQRYAPDGDYIPRTLFLRPDGTLAADIHARRDRFLYFWDENDPADVLRGLDEARALR